MAWTNKQKSLFAQACTAIGYDQDRRRMVLSSFPNAIAGKSYATSTSKRLNNSDFEHAMAIVESVSNGQVKVRWSVTGKFRYGLWHWRRKADDDLARMRRLVGAITGALQAAGNLEPNGVGLAGWISSRITHGRTDRLNQLTYNEIYSLIEGLKAYARRNGVRLDK